MSQETIELSIPELLPTQEGCERCISDLRDQVAISQGVADAAVTERNGGAWLRVAFDTTRVDATTLTLTAQQAGAGLAKRFRHESLRVLGMDCADCARSIEHLLARAPGVVSVSVNYASERVRVEYEPVRLTHAELVRRIGQLGYQVIERKPTTWLTENADLISALTAALVLLIAFLIERSTGSAWPLAIPFYLVAYGLAAYEAAWHGLRAALHLRFDVDFLMVVAALGAAALGDWVEGGLLLVLFALGHAAEHYALGRARQAMNALEKMSPLTARVRRNGSDEEIRVDDLLRGDVMIVLAGERIPGDGIVRQGRSAVDQSAITGESLPCPKEIGDAVYAGTVNGAGVLEVENTRLARESTLARVLRLVEEAQAQKSPTQRLTERWTRVFTPVMLAIVGLFIVVPPLLGLLRWDVAFLRAMTILIAASPCALAIASPAAMLSGLAQAARHGILVKGGGFLETLGQVNAIAFDKTGTLTVGQPAVTDVIAFGQHSKAEVLQYAAALERRANHPIARAITAASGGSPALPALDVTEDAGLGVRGQVGGQEIAVGSMRFVSPPDAGGRPSIIPADLNGALDSASLPTTPAGAISLLEAQGKGAVAVAIDGAIAGIIGVADQVRPEALAVMRTLSDRGIELAMLTGDNPQVAHAVARGLGVGKAVASLLPADKLAAIQQLRAEYGKVAMVGDGVNDAPALALADVGIAMGAHGADAALETADVALMADDLTRLPFAIGLGRQTNLIVRQNLWVALGVVALLVPSAALGLAGIGPAILLHEGSTVAVALNALRLLRYDGAR
jgi:Zn2+/Cd2+-exporting ATPase